MNNLVLVRHGDYDAETGSLDSDGIAQVERLAAALKDVIQFPVRVISSTTLRTVETAMLIAAALECGDPVMDDVLNADSNAGLQSVMIAIDGIVERTAGDTETAILVTHDHLIHGYVNHRMRDVHPQRKWHLGLGYAEAIVIEIDGEKASILRLV